MLLLAAAHVLVVLAGDPTEDGTVARAIERALRGALGSEAVIDIDVVAAGSESDDVFRTKATNEDASLLSVVRWTNGNKQASLRFVRLHDDKWSVREIRFDAADAPAERGRTVGFTIASMVPDEALRPKPEAPPTPIPAPRSEQTTADHAEAPAVRASKLHSLEALGQAAGAVGGKGGGFGGALGVRIGLSQIVQLRFAAGARFEEIASAAATSRTYVGGAGVAVRAWSDATRRWKLGGRLQALLVGSEVVHFSEDDPEPVHQLRVLPGADAALELSFHFVDTAGVRLAAGSEVAFGRTDVFVRSRKVEEIVPVRPFVELGLEVSF